MVFLPSYYKIKSLFLPHKNTHEKTTQYLLIKQYVHTGLRRARVRPASRVRRTGRQEGRRGTTRRLLPRDDWFCASFFCIRVSIIRFFLLPKSIVELAERLKDLEQKRVFSNLKRLMRDACVLSKRRKRRRRPTTTTTTTTTTHRRRLFCPRIGHHHHRFGTPTTAYIRGRLKKKVF